MVAAITDQTNDDGRYTANFICDPSVTALDDGYLIVYKANPGQ